MHDAHLLDVALEDAPRLFAIVEDRGDRSARVAGYGLAFGDRIEVDSVEGDFHLSAESAESALAVFEVSTDPSDVRRVHLVWLDVGVESPRLDQEVAVPTAPPLLGEAAEPGR